MPTRRLPLVVLAALLVPAASYAMLHLKLVRSEPAANATLAAAPAQVKLWFSQAPQLPVTRLSLVRADGAPTALTPVTRADGANEPIVAPLPAGLAPGTWTIRWRTVAKDGHAVKGDVRFTIAAPAAR
ncbi:MAG: copper resistance protein CopC [Gemmatimonadaceae bacterium]|jgi:hypothetical protein|nr:copper resistance protein CopC [Gemmatimonadaceae bacterium]